MRVDVRPTQIIHQKNTSKVRSHSAHIDLPFALGAELLETHAELQAIVQVEGESSFTDALRCRALSLGHRLADVGFLLSHKVVVDVVLAEVRGASHLLLEHLDVALVLYLRLEAFERELALPLALHSRSLNVLHLLWVGHVVDDISEFFSFLSWLRHDRRSVAELRLD